MFGSFEVWRGVNAFIYNQLNGVRSLKYPWGLDYLGVHRRVSRWAVLGDLRALSLGNSGTNGWLWEHLVLICDFAPVAQTLVLGAIPIRSLRAMRKISQFGRPQLVRSQNNFRRQICRLFGYLKDFRKISTRFALSDRQSSPVELGAFIGKSSSSVYLCT